MANSSTSTRQRAPLDDMPGPEPSSCRPPLHCQTRRHRRVRSSRFRFGSRESVVLRSYVAWAVVEHGQRVDVDYVVGAPTKWANHVRDREPVVHAEFVSMSTDLGFNPPEIKRMWATLAELLVISGIRAGVIADDDYVGTRDTYLAVDTGVSRTLPIFSGHPSSVQLGDVPPPPWASTVTPDTGRQPQIRLGRTRRRSPGPHRDHVPLLSLDQLAVSLRPGSVETIDTTLRMFGRFIADHHNDVVGAADISRVHIEAFKPWLVARPGKVENN